MASEAVAVLLLVFLSGSTFGIKLEGNGYTDVLIAINPVVPENPLLIERIKEMMSNASSVLFTATEDKFYFEEITILVPPNWSQGGYGRTKTETYEKAKIIINEENRAYGDQPYTLQYGQCGSESRYIHLTTKFILDDELIKLYGPRDKVLVHEWAHLRWGVYDEFDDGQPFYKGAHSDIQATRCSLELDGKIVNRINHTNCTHIDPNNKIYTQDCVFLADSEQWENTASLMSYPSLHKVTRFCSNKTHNSEAPNAQNRMCDNRDVMDVIFTSSVDAKANVQPLKGPHPVPRFTVMQRGQRVVCLVLDVSGSMRGSRILQQQQAASLFLTTIVEDHSYVGIVTFTKDAKTLKPLTVIHGEESRTQLVRYLPSEANGGTDICKGLKKGFEELRKDNGNTMGDEIILLTDGESELNCASEVKESGAIVNTIALGPSANKELKMLSEISGGKYFYASENLDQTELVNVFASLTTTNGDLTHQTILLDSSGMKGKGILNGTVSVDHTIGNKTTFLVLHESQSPEDIEIKSPSGQIYDFIDFQHSSISKMHSLVIQGTAETGEWTYTIKNTLSDQYITITITSCAVSDAIPPVTVKAHMSQQSIDGSKPMLVYAEVNQKGVPVILADVMATLKSDSGDQYQLQLLDNGAGADAFRNDGIYSRYFTTSKNGRYNLKVKVQRKNKSKNNGQVRLKRHSVAPYVPGYVIKGKVVMNPPKPPVSEDDLQADVGSFTRTAIGESFSVSLPPGVPPPNFPPNKITDLNAEIEEDKVMLTWTAPGEDMDQGTADSYEIRVSMDLEALRGSFSGAHLMNTSDIRPLEAGSTEEYSFLSSYIINAEPETVMFFAVRSCDKDSLMSDMSNVAKATKIVPFVPTTTTPTISQYPSPNLKRSSGSNVVAVVVSVIGTAAVIIAVLVVTRMRLNRPGNTPNFTETQVSTSFL
ncbi:calcium-activated chloride channel regulator 1-like [Oncorhynchus mykiss]|uniref:calcium-activated chloride channel regulator 1-like n=1 Tax=Oncorhynchus mykiss TaxID=8022 RepID=UPI001878D1BA|nr:calcium-activated chloride channel regulator 1-like [Oncorhynchus mykiss]